MRNRQRGFGALEVMIALIIASLMIVAGTRIYQRYIDLQANLNAGEHMHMVAEAAAKYIQENRAAVLAAAGPTTPAAITVAMLRTTGYLPTGFSDKNAYSQDYRILAIEPTTDTLQTLIVTINGDTIQEMSLFEIAKSIGARGGYVSSTNTAVATGSFGGWQTALAPYGVTPGAGHLATALFVDDSSTTNDYLYRNAIPGQPELNEMNTALGMRGNNINNAGAVSASGVSVTGNTSTTGETYTGGWFRTRGDSGWYNEKWVGGWYMSDPTWVRSYANKSVYTGGEMRGGTLRSEGRTTVGEYLQLSGVATEGTACSPNGLVGRNPAGLTLSCQSGVWKGNTGEQSCFYMTIAGSSLTFRGVGLLEGARFSGTMLRADRPAPSYYFGYQHDCRSDTACVASRGAYVASIGGSGSFHSILHVVDLPVQAASACF